MPRDQIWKSEESNWSCRNLEREIFHDLAKTQIGKILEIGPGYGRLMAKLKKIDKNITGLENSRNLSMILKKKELNVITGNGLDIPFKSESFSCVLLEEVLEHIKEQPLLLKEIYRILKMRGTLIIATPNKWIYRFFMYISNIINCQWSVDLIKNPTPGHIAECSYSSLMTLFENFQIIKTIPINPYLLPQLLKYFPNLAINFVLVAKKNSEKFKGNHISERN